MGLLWQESVNSVDVSILICEREYPSSVPGLNLHWPLPMLCRSNTECQRCDYSCPVHAPCPAPSGVGRAGVVRFLLSG